MNRRLTNMFRLVMDECLPPCIRDSKVFMYPFFLIAYKGKKIREAMNFKSNVHHWTAGEYADFYGSIRTISRNRPTDLNEGSIRLIIAKIDKSAKNLIDVGCGSGYFLSRLHASGMELFGCDIVDKTRYKNFKFSEANIDKLPFADKQFDVVVCSHTLEHMLDIKKSIGELKRICKKQIIITVPRQREFYYTLDEHLHFFPYQEKLNSVIDIKNHECVKVNGDWVYVGWV